MAFLSQSQKQEKDLKLKLQEVVSQMKEISKDERIFDLKRS